MRRSLLLITTILVTITLLASPTVQTQQPEKDQFPKPHNPEKDEFPKPETYPQAGANCKDKGKLEPWLGMLDVGPGKSRCILSVSNCQTDKTHVYRSAPRESGTVPLDCSDYQRAMEALGRIEICCDPTVDPTPSPTPRPTPSNPRPTPTPTPTPDDARGSWPGWPSSPTSSADLTINKVSTRRTLARGSRVTYRIFVINLGPNAATNLVVTDQLPRGISFVSARVSQPQQNCSFANRTLTCNLGTLPNGGGANIKIVATMVAAPGSQITNTASVRSATSDPNSANNADDATVSVLRRVELRRLE